MKPSGAQHLIELTEQNYPTMAYESMMLIEVQQNTDHIFTTVPDLANHFYLHSHVLFDTEIHHDIASFHYYKTNEGGIDFPTISLDRK